jgi:hypothetical protein
MYEVRATVAGSTIKRVTTAYGDSDGGGEFSLSTLGRYMSGTLLLWTGRYLLGTEHLPHLHTQ